MPQENRACHEELLRAWGIVMPLYPGDYLDDVQIESCSAWQGAGFFSYKGNPCFLLNRDAPEITITPGLFVRGLVCVGYDRQVRRYRCMRAGGSFDCLVETLYITHRLNKNIKKEFASMWMQRWKQAALSKEEVRCIEIDIEKYPLPERCWIALKHAGWEMPVPAYEYFNVFDGGYHFFPAMMNGVYFALFHQVISPAYKNATSRIELPLKFQANLELYHPNATSPNRFSTDIFLHSFIVPQKLHFGVWKHMLGLKREKEKRCWTQRMKDEAGSTLPSREEAHRIFSECRENADDTSCGKCNIARYRNVHREIAVYSSFYIESAVTFFKVITTEIAKPVFFTAEKMHENVYAVQFILTSGTRSGAGSTKMSCGGNFARAVFRGMLFIEDQAASMHLNPVTFFFTTNANTPVALGQKTIFGKLNNVHKSDD